MGHFPCQNIAKQSKQLKLVNYFQMAMLMDIAVSSNQDK